MRRNPTEAEKRLWTMLRNRRLDAHKFKRQRVIFPYIVDFACLTTGLIIEADGSQHADSRDDARRDAFLGRAGFRVLRFWNSDVLTYPDGVFRAICEALTCPHPPTPAAWAPPSPLAGRGVDHGALPNA
jgi:very-short-patch-repair endonuclease